MAPKGHTTPAQAAGYFASNHLWDASSRTVRLQAARGEFVAFQVVIKGAGVEPVQWYGVWLFVDWLDFAGVQLDPTDTERVRATAAAELEASRRDPYRGISRVFHLMGRKSG